MSVPDDHEYVLLCRSNNSVLLSSFMTCHIIRFITGFVTWVKTVNMALPSRIWYVYIRCVVYTEIII